LKHYPNQGQSGLRRKPLRSKPEIAKHLAQIQPGTLQAGVDLGLEKNVVVAINEKAERLDHFSLPQD
jgi:hypothetical protein